MHETAAVSNGGGRSINVWWRPHAPNRSAVWLELITDDSTDTDAIAFIVNDEVIILHVVRLDATVKMISTDSFWNFQRIVYKTKMNNKNCVLLNLH